MKKKFTRMLFLALFLTFVGQVWADNYDLWVAGVQVTDANKSSITGEGISGKVSYDPANNILTIEDATITSVNGNAIFNEIEELNINLIGNNTTISTGCAINTTADLSITGKGSLVVTGGNDCGIFVQNCFLVIEGVSVTATGEWGIAGSNGDDEYLIISNAFVKATGTQGSICEFYQVILDYCHIVSPAGADFSDSRKGIALGGAIVTDEVVIEPAYYLWIAGTQVTLSNKADILGDGKVSYDPATNTLTLNNATITSNNKTGIDILMENLKIELIGNNAILTGGRAVSSHVDFSIVGSGSLDAYSYTDCGIVVLKHNLTIEGASIFAEGKWGIAGDFGGESEILTIKNASVKARGKEGAICDFKNIVLDSCEVCLPIGAAFDATLAGIALDGTLVKDKMVWIDQIKYGLWVADKQVTIANQNDILGDGKVSYDPATNTLTLNNATITSNLEFGISNEIPNLIINLIGDNTVTAADYYEAILSSANISIVGNGSLVASSTNTGIHVEECNLTIDGVSVTATGEWGIAGLIGVCEILTIKNATVKANGTTCSIGEFKDIILDGCEITSPVGVAFDKDVLGIALDGERVKGEVVISPTTDLENVKTNNVIFSKNGRIFAPDNAKIYDLLGRNVTQMNGNLSGIYIVKFGDKTEKVIVR